MAVIDSLMEVAVDDWIYVIYDLPPSELKSIESLAEYLLKEAPGMKNWREFLREKILKGQQEQIGPYSTVEMEMLLVFLDDNLEMWKLDVMFPMESPLIMDEITTLRDNRQQEIKYVVSWPRFGNPLKNFNLPLIEVTHIQGDDENATIQFNHQKINKRIEEK
jgi:hypothetical protein